MGRTAKISISVPDALLKDVERARASKPESRSEFFTRAAESLLRQEEERVKIARYVQGYIDQPEGEEEAAWAELSRAQLAEVPWS